MLKNMVFHYALEAEWLEKLKKSWSENLDIGIAKCVIFALVLLVLGVGLCAIVWYIQLGYIVEVGYPKRSKRRKRQGLLIELKDHSRINQLFLWRLCKDAPRKHWFMWFSFGINLLNILVVAVCCVSGVCAIITTGAGWTWTLLILLPYNFLLFVVLVEFIPSVIYIPSERRRYGK